jgi:hypothetical protein
MGHLFLPGGHQVSLVIRRQAGKERSHVDDIRVGGHRQGLADFRDDQDVAVALLRFVALVEAVLVLNRGCPLTLRGAMVNRPPSAPSLDRPFPRMWYAVLCELDVLGERFSGQSHEKSGASILE